MTTAWHLGYAYSRVGQPDRGILLLEEAVHRATDSNCWAGHSMRIGWLAEALLFAKKTERAGQFRRAAPCQSAWRTTCGSSHPSYPGRYLDKPIIEAPNCGLGTLSSCQGNCRSIVHATVKFQMRRSFGRLWVGSQAGLWGLAAAFPPTCDRQIRLSRAIWPGFQQTPRTGRGGFWGDGRLRPIDGPSAETSRRTAGTSI